MGLARRLGLATRLCLLWIPWTYLWRLLAMAADTLGLAPDLGVRLLIRRSRASDRP